MHEPLKRLFVEYVGSPPEAILELRADGSNRTYYRLLRGPFSAIGAVGPDAEENRAFLSYSRAFRSIGLNVPQIYGDDPGAGVWLEEDLGNTTLFDALVEAREAGPGNPFPEAVVGVYRRVVEVLPRFQVEGGQVVDYSVAYPRAAFDLQSILWDLNYFKYHFLKLAHVPFNEGRLEDDFARLAGLLLQADTSFFLYRDFQSRNVMLRQGEPWFIDYQGGRRGALHYDIASLLYDAKAAIPDPLREELLEHYLDALEGHLAVDRPAFRQLYRGYVLVRIMQAMGAYGYRGFFERKARFLQSVPYAARNIEGILAQGLPVSLPALEAVFHRIVQAWTDGHRRDPEQPGLTVNVGSFSYRQGLPEDGSGHGGGFVFDCRGLPNPGRQPQYAGLTGRDAPVIAFLEASPEVEAYWAHVRGLVDAQVQQYLRLGFTNLSVWFGCTGGQHRSVYLAERLDRHLQQAFPQAHVRLVHREQLAWAQVLEQSDSPG
ncbi:MAG: RNase adapter RapZ [Candidatus Latescibacterota bacterium]